MSDQQIQNTDNTVQVSYTPVAPALAEAGFTTHLPRETDTAHAVLLTEDNLDRVAQAIGGKVLEGSVRRLRYPAMGHRGPTACVAHIGEVLVQIPEAQLDPWRVNNSPLFYVDSKDNFDKGYFLPGRPQHLDPAPVPAEDADTLREYTDSLDRSNPYREEDGYKLDLALEVYDRLAQEPSQVLRHEQVYAALYLRDLARSASTDIPVKVETAMDRLARWMITQTAGTHTPVTTKGTRFMDRSGNTYIDRGDGTLRSNAGYLLDYSPVEPYAKVLFEAGPLTRVPLDD